MPVQSAIKALDSQCTRYPVSDQARAMHNDVFLWCPTNRCISLSWCNSNLELTVEAMYRFFETVVIHFFGSWPIEKVLQNYAFFPITVLPEKTTPLRHLLVLNSSSTPLPRDSKEVVKPGEYGIYTRERSKPMYSFDFVMPYNLSPAPLYKLNKMKLCQIPHASSTPSQELKTAAFQRDEGRCPFTGQQLDIDSPTVKAFWYLPLWAGYMTIKPVGRPAIDARHTMAEDVHEDPTICDALKTVDNCFVTTQEVYDLLMSNKITVDVEDDYRIVRFVDQDEIALQLRKNLLRTGSLGQLDDKYLAAHFRYTVPVNIMGGDVLESHSVSEAADFLDEHYLGQGRFDWDRDDWSSTILGRCVFEWAKLCSETVGDKPPSIFT